MPSIFFNSSSSGKSFLICESKVEGEENSKDDGDQGEEDSGKTDSFVDNVPDVEDDNAR